MQVTSWWRSKFTAVSVSLMLCGCHGGVLFHINIKGADQSLVAYRLPAGPFSERIDLKLESPDRSILLHSYYGEWHSARCAAAVFSPDRKQISYVVSISGPVSFIGTYDTISQRDMPLSLQGAELLRNEIARIYKGRPGVPPSDHGDLVAWAADGVGCEAAFREVYGNRGGSQGN